MGSMSSFSGAHPFLMEHRWSTSDIEAIHIRYPPTERGPYSFEQEAAGSHSDSEESSASSASRDLASKRRWSEGDAHSHWWPDHNLFPFQEYVDHLKRKRSPVHDLAGAASDDDADSNLISSGITTTTSHNNSRQSANGSARGPLESNNNQHAEDGLTAHQGSIVRQAASHLQTKTTRKTRNQPTPSRALRQRTQNTPKKSMNRGLGARQRLQEMYQKDGGLLDASDGRFSVNFAEFAKITIASLQWSLTEKVLDFTYRYEIDASSAAQELSAYGNMAFHSVSGFNHQGSSLIRNFLLKLHYGKTLTT